MGDDPLLKHRQNKHDWNRDNDNAWCHWFCFCLDAGHVSNDNSNGGDTSESGFSTSVSRGIAWTDSRFDCGVPLVA